MQHTLKDTGISYTLTYKQVKRINLRVRPDGSVHLSAPMGTPLDRIEAFLLEKRRWIESALDRQKSRIPSLPMAYLSGEKVSLLGEELLLIVRQGRPSGVTVSDGFLFLTVRDETDLAQKQRILERALRSRAQAIFEQISQEFYPVFSKILSAPPEIKVRRMNSLWGSCAYQKGRITLNLSLIHYPMDCIRAIVAHEYCHFVHPNHGKAFYALLHRVYPSYESCHQQLNQWNKGGVVL